MKFCSYCFSPWGNSNRIGTLMGFGSRGPMALDAAHKSIVQACLVWDIMLMCELWMMLDHLNMIEVQTRCVQLLAEGSHSCILPIAVLVAGVTVMQCMDIWVVHQCLPQKTNYIFFVYLLTQEIYRTLPLCLAVNKIQVDKCIRLLSHSVKVQRMNEQTYGTVSMLGLTQLL